MEHYIAYHSVELMGHGYAPSATFSFDTQKSEKYVRRTIGSRVWVLVGRREGKRMTYKLVGTYISQSMRQRDKSGWEIEGSGKPFDPPVDVTERVWFKALLGEQRNFSLGLNRIRDAMSIDQLESVLRQHEGSKPGHANAANLYTIVSSDILEKHALDGSAMERTEGKVWKTATKLFTDACARQRRLPVLFADAKDCSRLLYWGLLENLDTIDSPPSTTYSVDKLRPFRGVRSPQELRLMRTGEFIAPGYIRPYANCRTPEFLSLAPDDVSAEIFLTSGEGPAPETLVEGAAITVTVSKYEHNQTARQQCIEHYGYSC